MKVNRNGKISQGPSELPVKSSGYSSLENKNSFTIQMENVLNQNKTDESIPSGKQLVKAGVSSEKTRSNAVLNDRQNRGKGIKPRGSEDKIGDETEKPELQPSKKLSESGLRHSSKNDKAVDSHPYQGGCANVDESRNMNGPSLPSGKSRMSADASSGIDGVQNPTGSTDGEILIMDSRDPDVSTPDHNIIPESDFSLNRTDTGNYVAKENNFSATHNTHANGTSSTNASDDSKSYFNFGNTPESAEFSNGYALRENKLSVKGTGIHTNLENPEVGHESGAKPASAGNITAGDTSEMKSPDGAEASLTANSKDLQEFKGNSLHPGEYTSAVEGHTFRQTATNKAESGETVASRDNPHGTRHDSKENGQGTQLQTGKYDNGTEEYQSVRGFHAESEKSINSHALTNEKFNQREFLPKNSVQTTNELSERNTPTKEPTESKAAADNAVGRPSEPPNGRIFQSSGEISDAAINKNSNTLKTAQSEMSHPISSGNSGIAGSTGAQGMNQAKTVMAHSNEFIPQVTERIQFLLRDGGGVIRIRLQPDEFGQMEIRAETTSKGVAARITAESNIVKNILEHSMSALNQSLQEQGLKVDRIQVLLQDGFDTQSSSEYSSRSGNSGSGHNEKGSNRHSSVSDHPEKEILYDTTDVDIYRHDSRFYTVA